MQGNADPGPIPEHLRRTAPGTAVADTTAPVAQYPNGAPPTPEQLEIANLKAQLEAAKTAKPRAKRSPAVKPGGGDGPVVTQASNSAAPVPAEEPPEVSKIGNDIAARIAGIVGG